MLAIKSRSALFIELVLGPYRKRGRRLLCLTTSEGVSNIDIDRLRAGVQLDQNFSLSASDGFFRMSLPSSARVSSVHLFGSEPLWNGVKMKADADSLSFRVSADKTLSVAIAGKEWVFSLAYEKPVSSEVVISPQEKLRNAIKTTLNFGQAILFHGSVFILAMLLGKGLHLPWLNRDAAQTEQQRVVEIETTVPVEMLMGSDTGFNGRGMSLAPTPESVAATQKRTTKIADGLSGLVARMSGLNISGIGKAEHATGSGTVDAAALQSLRDRLGQAQGGDLKANFKFVGQGAGKHQKWNLYGDPSKEFSAKDLESIAAVFHGLQDQFQNCYESALLKFDALAVVVQFEGAIEAGGRLGTPSYVVTGKSEPEAEGILKGCLTKVLQKASFKSGLSGARIRNQFMFKS